MKTSDNSTKNSPTWMEIVSKYNFSDPMRSWWQIANSIVPYILLWVLMVWSLKISYFLTLFLSIFAAGFLVRIFIIFHDCGHGSYFKSKLLSRIIGIITGIFAFTPYHKWHNEHQEHHATVGNLDKRGVGDVKTLTIDEFLELSPWQKFSYRFYRHPLFLFGLAPFLVFVLQNRLPRKSFKIKDHVYLALANLGLVVAIGLTIWAIGWKAYLLIQIPVLYIASVHGIWLFYVQHQYEHVVWSRAKDWNYKEIALEGSSYFKLPKVLQWFTGNIGFHHIHHLSPKIPNYKLPECHEENQVFQDIKPVTFFSSLKSLKLRLWDEKKQKLVGFKALRYYTR
ncbi:MAG: fatty acid desaturase [Bacteroidia bacterium]|nr:fatty acid desaturase [Bacteroidia bacterium]